jgi:hypothetical protein
MTACRLLHVDYINFCEAAQRHKAAGRFSG